MTTQPNSELLPCPFCGSTELEVDHHHGFLDYKGRSRNKCMIYCVKCSAEISECYHDFPAYSEEEIQEQVHSRWNTRASTPPLNPSELSQIMETCDFIDKNQGPWPSDQIISRHEFKFLLSAAKRIASLEQKLETVHQSWLSNDKAYKELELLAEKMHEALKSTLDQIQKMGSATYKNSYESEFRRLFFRIEGLKPDIEEALTLAQQAGIGK